MKLPHLEPRQRLLALLGAVAVLVLVAGVVLALRGDDGTTDQAGATTTTAAEGSETTDGAATEDDAASDPEGQGQGGTSTTTGTADPTDPDATAPGAPGGDPEGAAGATDPPGVDGQPAPAPDPVGGGEGANVGVVDPDDAQSPPLIEPAGPQGPTRPEPCAGTGPPTIPLPQRDGPSGDGGGWVTVGSLAGNCGATGASFPTSGVDTRLVFRSDAEQMIVFVDDLDDPDAAAGYADVECRVRCAGTRILVNRGGSFRLRVQATDGPWQVELQEYRR